MRGIVSLFVVALTARLFAADPKPEALLVVAADLHSAYDRTAQFVARVDRLKSDHPGVPLAILIDGDAFEYGNAIARRTSGAIDFAMFTALARRGPTIVNLGNHEPEFYEMTETIQRLTATGVKVIGASISRPDGVAYAPGSVELPLGPHSLVVVGLTTNRLETFRAAVRPSLQLRDPVTTARQIFAGIFKDAPLPIVLSHAGLKIDRAILEFTPDGTLFAGAHDHLRFVHRAGRTVYFHSGSWMEFISIARLQRDGKGQLGWQVEQVPIAAADPVDAALAKLIHDTFAEHLTAEETAVVGRSPRALGPSEAARFAVEAARQAASADAAMISATTFGAGLPAGEVTRFAFDACVRFDGPLFVADVDGAWLQKLAARANQGPDTAFAARGGENLVLAAPPRIVAAQRYRFVTSDWAVKNAKIYFGDDVPAFTEHPTLKLKAAVTAALRP